MESKKKAEAVGRILILSREIDTVRGENLRLQKILVKELYYQSGNKWYYDIQKLGNKTISELNEIADQIEKSI